MGEKVYICGKITGNKDFKKQFKEAEDTLTSLGYVVINPANLPSGLSQMDYMVTCIIMLSRCKYIYPIGDYKSSEGTIIELQFANKVGITQLPMMGV